MAINKPKKGAPKSAKSREYMTNYNAQTKKVARPLGVVSDEAYRNVLSRDKATPRTGDAYTGKPGTLFERQSIKKTRRDKATRSMRNMPPGSIKKPS